MDSSCPNIKGDSGHLDYLSKNSKNAVKGKSKGNSLRREKTIGTSCKTQSLWNGQVFCLVGFAAHKSQSHKMLLYKFLRDISNNGGKYVLEETLKTKIRQYKDQRWVDYLVCNYSDGYKQVDLFGYSGSIIVTPIWLHLCHLHGLIYPHFSFPFFIPNRNFSPGSDLFSILRICIICGDNKSEVGLKFENDFASTSGCANMDNFRYVEILRKFVILSGAAIVEENSIKDNSYLINDIRKNEELNCVQHLSSVDIPTHFIVCGSVGYINTNIVRMSIHYSVPILSVQWLYDSYIRGVPLPSAQYNVEIDESGNINNFFRSKERTDLLRSVALKSYNIYISHRVALRNKNLRKMCELMGGDVFIDRPSLLITREWLQKEVDEFVSKNKVFIVDEKEIEDGLWEEIFLYLFNSHNSESPCNAESITNSAAFLSQSHHMFSQLIKESLRFKKCDLHIVKEIWIHKCWETMSPASISLDNGLILPSFILNHMNTFDEAKRRRKEITFKNLANSILCTQEIDTISIENEMQLIVNKAKKSFSTSLEVQRIWELEG